MLFTIERWSLQLPQQSRGGPAQQRASESGDHDQQEENEEAAIFHGPSAKLVGIANTFLNISSDFHSVYLLVRATYHSSLQALDCTSAAWRNVAPCEAKL